MVQNKKIKIKSNNNDTTCEPFIRGTECEYKINHVKVNNNVFLVGTSEMCCYYKVNVAT